MRAVVRGLLIGILLSCLRAPRGLSLVELPAASSGSALGWRAAALAVVAIALFASLRRPGFVLLASAAVGYALHGLVLAAWIAPASTTSLAIVTVLGLSLAVAVALGERKPHPPEAPEPAHAHRSAFVAEHLGLFVLGAGTALALEAVARHVRPFGSDLAQDDAVFGVAFLAIAAVGALVLGLVARVAALRALALPLLSVACAASGLFALHVAGELVKLQGLEHLVQRFGLALADHGTLAYDLLVGATLLAAPALLAGGALAAATNGRRAFALLAGAAQGLLLVKVSLAPASGVGPEATSVPAAELVAWGVLIAATGAALALLSTPGPKRAPRYGALAAVLAMALVPLLRETAPLVVRAPWDDANPFAPRTYQLAIDAPEGPITVEALGGSPVVATLDGHALTSGIEGAQGEIARTTASIACVPSARRARGRLAVLLVGQLDPLRDVLLRRAGVVRVDRTAAWHASMPRVEARFFKDAAPLDGDLVDPAEAMERVRAGRYDLVLVPPVPGDAPSRPTLDVPATTTLVAWISADAPLASADLGDEVVLASAGLDDPCVALVANAERPATPGPDAPHFARTGAKLRAPTPLAELALRDAHDRRERSSANRAALFDRLAAAARGTSDVELFEALAVHARTRATSASDAKAAELDGAMLAALARHADANVPDLFVRGVWEGVAGALVAEHEAARARRWLEPVAKRHGPWLALEKALARAEIETSDPAAAVARLEAIGALGRGDFDYWQLLGDARRAAKDALGATRAWRQALELRPAHQVLKRKLAIALVRLGEPGGRELVEELLRDDPKDERLKTFLGPGPWPDEE